MSIPVDIFDGSCCAGIVRKQRFHTRSRLSATSCGRDHCRWGTASLSAGIDSDRGWFSASMDGGVLGPDLGIHSANAATRARKHSAATTDNTASVAPPLSTASSSRSLPMWTCQILYSSAWAQQLHRAVTSHRRITFIQFFVTIVLPSCNTGYTWAMLSGTQAVLQQKHHAGTCGRQKTSVSSLNRIQIDTKHSSYATANDEFSAEAIRATQKTFCSCRKNPEDTSTQAAIIPGHRSSQDISGG